MNKDEFWQLIETTKSESQNVGILQAELLVKALEQLSEEDIIEFDSILGQLLDQTYDWRLWGAAILIRCFCSDDSFDYFQAWLVGQGEEIYQKALENPDTLFEVVKTIKPVETRREELMYVATTAYENKTGREMPFQPVSISSGIKGQKKTIEEWIEDYPALGKLYRANCEGNS